MSIYSGKNRQFLATKTIEHFNLLIQEHPNIIENIKNTIYYTNTSFNLNVKNNKNTIINVINSDTISLTKELVRLGINPLVLNMVNENHLSSGDLVQKYDLFLCSTYDLSLNNNYNINKNRSWCYPIGAIYSPGVLIFRNSKNYSILPKNERYFVDFIAICRPKLENKRLLDLNLILEKIRTIFSIAILNNHTTLLLGDFSCGASPYDVAICFKHVLNEPKFKNVFHNIYFGIIDNKKTNDFSIFKQILENV
jgi:uncharacterized protein (TIGR02452 family)